MRFRKKKRDSAALQSEVQRLGWWYQFFPLPGGVWTGAGQPPSYNPETRWKLIEPFVPSDLSGKSVLDVGGNAGYFSIQMKKRGAGRCVMVEPYVEFVRQAELVARAFDVELEIVNQDVHTYCLTTRERFDFVLFLGLFYHLKYPVLVLDRLAEMTKQRLYFQCAVVDPCGEPGLPLDFPRLAFIEGTYNMDPTNWWIPNSIALEPLLRSAGMNVISSPSPDTLIAEPREYFGKAILGNLVFPRYGKTGGAIFPGKQSVPVELWDELLRKSQPGVRE